MSAEAHSMALPEHTAPESAGSRAAAPVLRALPKLRQRQKGLIAGVIGLLALALTVVLAVNIHVANSQYAVVALQNDHRTLVQTNQALTEQLQHLESPQSLSRAAVGLGMVMPAESAAFNIENGKIIGAAEAADSGDRPSGFVATPEAPGDGAAAPLNVSESASGAPAGILGAGALNTLASPPSGQNDQEESAGTRSQFSPEELNGGTIPAPSFD